MPKDLTSSDFVKFTAAYQDNKSLIAAIVPNKLHTKDTFILLTIITTQTVSTIIRCCLLKEAGVGRSRTGHQSCDSQYIDGGSGGDSFSCAAVTRHHNMKLLPQRPWPPPSQPPRQAPSNIAKEFPACRANTS